jgi:2-oxoglutarate dehydrogenase complex dehydrogenase (E1) component-like enzyme
VRTIKRAESASPATGSPEAHKLEQKALLALAFAGVGGK